MGTEQKRTPAGREWLDYGIGLGCTEVTVIVDGRELLVSFQGDHKRPFTGAWVANWEDDEEMEIVVAGGSELSERPTDEEIGQALDEVVSSIA